MNPIINSPYLEPLQHFRFNERGMSEDIVLGRRASSHFVPIPKAKNVRGNDSQMSLDNEWTIETMRDNELINSIREKVAKWRSEGYPGVTNTTRSLLEHWTDPERLNKLFFCQIEALESLIFIIEVAQKRGEHGVLGKLREANMDANPKLFRLALKMATGSGKTVVMSMIIAWQTLNKVTDLKDTRFTDTFVVITPGITIRDRLNVLEPGQLGNYYEARDIVPLRFREMLSKANIVITNFHSFEPRTRFTVATALKNRGLIKDEAMKESTSTMIARVLKGVRGKQNIIVINDEAHHCYREKPDSEKWSGDDKKEATENNEAARVWIAGIEAMKEKIGVNAVIDLSATPSFLKGSGYKEGTLFPWVISDFSLIDAIECGIVKIPRLPTYQNTNEKEPSYRNLWMSIRDDLPKKGRGKNDTDLVPQIPALLEGAIQELYSNYEKKFKEYEERKATHTEEMPPVMIFVCNNTSVSELIYNYVSGYETISPTGETVIKSGKLGIFRNEKDGKWLDKPNTLIIDSEEIESGRQIDENFKRMFGAEIESFQKEYKARYPGRDNPTDEEILREVMNTVGKRGRLGENIKCVISVSMLTEGWDVNTVTHVLGIRAFSTQLLCEQVVGRALRRMSYVANDQGMLLPEYAEVYGVPFNFVPGNGSSEPPPPVQITRVYALEERSQYEMTFPRVEGYRYEFDESDLSASWSDDLKLIIENFPTETIVEPVVGESYTATPEELQKLRTQEIIYELTSRLLDRHFKDKDGQVKYWLFPKLKPIVEEYIEKHVVLKDDMFIGLLRLSQYANQAVANIHRAIIPATKKKFLLPIVATYDRIGSTRYVDFTTVKDVQPTVKSHISHVVGDSDWELSVEKKLEDISEVICYVKNQGLDFYIPYDSGGMTRRYIPDFIVKLRKKDGSILNLLIEVTGKKDDKKKAKVNTTKNQWIPAVNNAKEYGEWAFIEIQDINETKSLLRYGLEYGFESIYPENIANSPLRGPLFDSFNS